MFGFDYRTFANIIIVMICGTQEVIQAGVLGFGSQLEPNGFATPYQTIQELMRRTVKLPGRDVP